MNNPEIQRDEKVPDKMRFIVTPTAEWNRYDFIYLVPTIPGTDRNYQYSRLKQNGQGRILQEGRARTLSLNVPKEVYDQLDPAFAYITDTYHQRQFALHGGLPNSRGHRGTLEINTVAIDAVGKLLNHGDIITWGTQSAPNLVEIQFNLP